MSLYAAHDDGNGKSKAKQAAANFSAQNLSQCHVVYM